MGGPPLEFINIQPKKGGPPLDFINQMGVRLQNSSTYSLPKGGPPLEFINIQPSKGGPPLEFINIQPQNGGPPLEFININLKMGVHLQGQFLWIQRYIFSRRPMRINLFSCTAKLRNSCTHAFPQPSACCAEYCNSFCTTMELNDLSVLFQENKQCLLVNFLFNFKPMGDYGRQK